MDERHYFVPRIPSRLGTFHTGGRFPGRSPPSNRGPSTLKAIFPDSHLSKPGTVHTRGHFPGWSPPSNRGPSTLKAIFPDSHLSKPGTFHTRGLFPGRSPPSNRGPSIPGACFPDGHRLGCGMKPDGAIPHRAGVVRLDRGVRWTGAWVTGWKRGRPFPRAARSFHQPPQLAGSAAAPPAPPELTLFTLDQTGQVYLVSVKKRETTYKNGHF